MSPSAGDAPRTPERRSSSSALLTAFRTLTSGRPKSNTVVTPPPAAFLTPLQSLFTKDEADPLSNARGKSLEDVTSGSSRTPPPDSESDIAIDAGSVVGGPPELQPLVQQLHAIRPLPERIIAAHKISDILKEYQVGNILTVWYAGSDLTTHESDDASYAGFTLLASCVKTTDLSSFERQTLFEAIHAGRSDQHLDIRFQALIDLSTSGRNVEPFECLLMPFINRLLKASFNTVTQARKKEKKAKVDPAKEEAAFDRLFKYIIDVTKFNATLLKEDSFVLLLDQIIGICKKTTSESDITSSTKVINTVITYTNIPSESLRPCLELLGDVYRQLVGLREQTWDTLSNIFRSHLGPRSVLELINVLQSASSPEPPVVNAIRGAFHVLGELLKVNGKHDLPRVPLGLLISAIENAFATRDRKFEIDVISLVNDCLGNRELKELLLDEADWTDLTNVIAQCVEDLSLSASNQNDIQSTIKSEDDTNAKIREPDRDPAMESFVTIESRLCTLLHELDFIHKEAIVGLFLRLITRISNDAAEMLVTYCAEEHLIYPSHTDWLETAHILATGLLRDERRPAALRVLVASVMKDAFSAILFPSHDAVGEFAMLVLEKISVEKEPSVLEILASFAVVVVDRADEPLFDRVLDLLRAAIFTRRPSLAVSPVAQPTSTTPASLVVSPVEPSMCRIATKQVIRMFIGNVNKSTRKAIYLFEMILQIASTASCATDARICAVKLMFRLRATADYAIYIRAVSESESIAAILCRTEETLLLPSVSDDSSANRDSRTASGGSAPTGSSKQRQFNIKTPVPPLWFYPGPKALPEEPSPEPSHCLYSYIDPEVDNQDDGRAVLKITHWLETIISLIQQPDVDWEIYSYILVHLGAQLANQNLFRGASPQIQFLRNVICDQIRASSFHEPPSHTSLKKADVAVCMFHILTMLIGHSDLFARGEQDEIIRSFILGLGSWDRTSKWCIHALSVCCHELTESVGKSLSSIVQKMSQIITQPQVAIHILEFLAVVARMPELYKNFREDEYKMVFGVSFRYLQYVRDQRDKAMSQAAARTGRATMRHSDSFRELRAASEQDIKSKDNSSSDDLPQYVYALAYHVITFWFMALKLDDRPLHIPWIKKNLTYIDNDGNEIIEDQGVVTMDMMDKVAYSDRDETVYNTNFAKSTDGEVSQKTWIVGYSLMTIETAGRTGLSQITRRRPSGTKYFIYHPALTRPPRHQVPITSGVAADAFYTSSYIGILPEDVLQEFYSSLSLAASPTILQERPVALPDDETVSRALSVFDRNSTVDGHKIGVIYIGPSQTTEAEILANTAGSAAYTTLISDLGTLTRLKGATFNTQGLDREFDTDGEYTYCWRDRVTEIVFHITSLMPTDLSADPGCTNKKKHVGNDFVNIIWNESGQEFRFDTFPSQFNYVYIVITPSDSPSFLDMRRTPGKYYYKVQMLSAPGFPELSPASEPKVLSAGALAGFVRLLALNASVFSLVWSNRDGGEHFSPWRNRLREIKRLRDKYVGPAGAVASPGGGLALSSSIPAYLNLKAPSPSLSMASSSALPTPSASASQSMVLGVASPLSGKERASLSSQQQRERSSLAATLASLSDRSSVTGSSTGGEE